MIDFMNRYYSIFKKSLKSTFNILITVLLLLAPFVVMVFPFNNLNYPGALAAPGTRATPVNGQHITVDTTWTSANSPYFIKGNIFVDPGINLTLEAGVEIQFEGQFSIYVDGFLNATGTELNPIIITSKVQSGRGDWNSVQINQSGLTIMKYVQMSYGSNNLYIKGASNNTLEWLDISESKKWGVWIENSHNNTINNSVFHLNEWSGLFIEDSSNNHIFNCSFHNNSYDGFTGDYSSNNILENCSFNDNLVTGAHIFSSSDFQLINCSSIKNKENGVIFSNSKKGIISNLRVFNNRELGLYFKYSTNFNLNKCKLIRNKVGFHLFNSTRITLNDSECYDNKNNGIFFEDSSSNKIINSKIFENANTGIFIREDVYHEYGSYKNEIVNCEISNNTNGIYLLNSPKSKIIQIKVKDNLNGIFLFEASNSTIKQCDIYNNLNGIRVWRSGDVGIIYNNIINNTRGIFLGADSLRNIVHHNYLLNNTLNGGDNNPGNYWDDTISEGNYWSDYNGTDYDENGIGDQPHNITNFSSDNYPLVDIKNTILKVLKTEPTNNEILVPMNTEVNITFSEKMVKDSILDRIILTPIIEILNYKWSNKDRTVSLQLPKLKNGTTYNIYIDKKVRSIWGKNLLFPFSFQFTTEDPLIIRHPKVVDYFPVGNTVPINSTINITFSEPMHQSSVENATSIYPVVQTNIYWQNNMTITIDPVENLSFNTNYTINIGTEAMNLIGNSMKSAFNFSFITESDHYSPYVIDHFPSGKALVPIDIEMIIVVFNEPMNSSSVEQRFDITPDINGNFEWPDENRTMYYNLDSDLQYNTTYTVKISKGAEDLSSNPTIEIFQFGFTTVQNKTIDNNTNETDLEPPYVIDRYPMSEVLIPVEIKMLILLFSEPVNTSSVEERFMITPPTKGTYVWKNENKTLEYQFSSFLLYNTNYTVQLLPGYMDIAGNPNLDLYDFAFKTIPGISHFIILDYFPKGSNVSVDSEIIIIFNKQPDCNSVENSFNIDPLINGTFKCKETTFIFKPDQNLSYNSTYIVLINNSAKDINGIFLNYSVKWEFSTQIYIDNGKKPDNNKTNGQNTTDNGPDSKDEADSKMNIFEIIIIISIIVIILIIIILILVKGKKKENLEKKPSKMDREKKEEVEE
jgi:parallel beta-helix repeat protein